jgi:hypothetical protein
MIYGREVNSVSDEDMLALLLHDAAEAYCGDLAAPLRVAMLKLHVAALRGYGVDEETRKLVASPYMEIYLRVADAIRQWAGLPEGAFESATVKHVDLRMLATERELFMHKPWIPDWIDLPPPYVNEADLMPSSLLDPQLQQSFNGRAILWCPWPAQMAASNFAQALADLMPQNREEMGKTPFPWSAAPPWALAVTRPAMARPMAPPVKRKK